MKRLLTNLVLLIACIVGLVGADMLYRQIEAQQPILEGAGGSALYADTFEQENGHWQTYEGRLSAQIHDSALSISINTPRDTAYSATLPLFADFDLRVQAQAVAGSVDNGFGVVFRLQEPITTCDMPLIVLCDLAQVDALNLVLRLMFRPQDRTPSGYYMFLISSDGYYSVWRAEESEGDSRARMISTWIESDAIRQGLDTMNEVRVVGVGDAFRFFINDEPVALCIPDNPNAESTYFLGECRDGQMQFIWRDASFARGKLGVVAHNPSLNELGIVIDFEQVIVYSPQPEILDDEAMRG